MAAAIGHLNDESANTEFARSGLSCPLTAQVTRHITFIDGALAAVELVRLCALGWRVVEVLNVEGVPVAILVAPAVGQS